MERVEMPAIDVKNISFAYQKGQCVFSGINFSVPRGGVMTILGPNGCGKTTLLNCILNNNSDYTGSILLFGEDLKSYSPKRYASKVAYVPQLTKLNFEYTVEDFVLMGVNPRKRYFDQPTQNDYLTVSENLEMLGIENLSTKMIGEISGGERQLAYIARALTQKPEVIIMDEPTSALDYSNQYKVINILKRLNSKGYTVILTSHNPEYAFMLGGQVGLMYRNKTFVCGEVSEVMTDVHLTDLYGMNIKVKYFKEFDAYVCVRTEDKKEDEHE